MNDDEQIAIVGDAAQQLAALLRERHRLQLSLRIEPDAEVREEIGLLDDQIRACQRVLSQ